MCYFDYDTNEELKSIVPEKLLRDKVDKFIDDNYKELCNCIMYYDEDDRPVSLGRVLHEDFVRRFYSVGCSNHTQYTFLMKSFLC